MNELHFGYNEQVRLIESSPASLDVDMEVINHTLHWLAFITGAVTVETLTSQWFIELFAYLTILWFGYQTFTFCHFQIDLSLIEFHSISPNGSQSCLSIPKQSKKKRKKLKTKT